MPTIRWRLASLLRRRPRSGRRIHEPDSRPWLEDSPVGPDAHVAEAYVYVRKADKEHADPGPLHVLPVQRRRAVVAGFADRTLGNLIQTSANQVTKGMASESVETQQNRIGDQYQRTDADTEGLAAGAVPPEGLPAVVSQDDDEGDREIQEVAMDVLENQREATLAPIGFARLANRACGWVCPEGLVISAAVVIAGEAEQARERQDQQTHRKGEEAGPPGRRRGEHKRRIKRRQIIGAGAIGGAQVMIALRARPGRIDDEGHIAKENQERFPPPGIFAGCLTEASLL